MRNIASIVILAASIAILAACKAVVGTAQTSVIQPSSPSPAKVSKTFALQSDGNLKISSVSGAIKVTAHDKDEVTLIATFKPSPRNNEYPRIEVDSKRNCLELKVKYPTRKFEAGWCELELLVPRRVNSRIKTVNGAIELNEIEGSHDISTVNGSVALANVGGDIYASTTNGNIRGTIQKNKGNLKSSTLNGSIALTLSDPNCSLNASTFNGKVTLDAPGAKDLISKKRSVSATFGNGDANIKLRSFNGSIVVQ